MKWYFEVLDKYAVFTGRARRKEYWMFFLFNMIAAFIVSFLSTFFSILFQTDLSFVNVSYMLGMIIPSVAVGVRRMHDIGRSGLWIICPVLNIVFLCIKGQPHENRFGPDPKLAL